MILKRNLFQNSQQAVQKRWWLLPFDPPLILPSRYALATHVATLIVTEESFLFVSTA